jgi:CheY-like chemotaxis protein
VVCSLSQIEFALNPCIDVRKCGEICWKAVDGLDAIEKAKTLNPDLIILDLSMPHMNGLEAARVLKNMLPSVPIILFTLHKAALVASDIANSGINSVLSKSDHLDILADHARRLLGSV